MLSGAATLGEPALLYFLRGFFVPLAGVVPAVLGGEGGVEGVERWPPTVKPVW